MEKQETRPKEQQVAQNVQSNQRELDAWHKKVHPETVKAVQETVEQYKNVLIELANR